MSNVGGPKGAGQSARMQEMLQRLRSKGDHEVDAQGDDGVAVHKADAFKADLMRQSAERLGGEASLMPATVAAAGAGVMDVRLNALRGQALQAGSVGPELIDGPDGPTVVGNINAERPEDLARLKGARALRGHLALSESAAKASDLSVLSTIQVIEGNLAIEGNRALDALDGLTSLGRVDGSVYLAFNEALRHFALPALSEVGRAFIVEGNAALTSFEVPSLATVGAYLHVHENDVLERAVFAALETLAGEISILDNPQLLVVEMPLLIACGGDVEIAQNGGSQLQGIQLPQ